MKGKLKKTNRVHLRVRVPSGIIQPVGDVEIKKSAERSTIEKALFISETKYRRLFETAQDGILILDYNSGKIVDANPFILKLIGYTKKQLIGRALWEIGAFHDIAKSKKAFSELQRKKYIRYEDKPLLNQDGTLVYVEFISNVYFVDRAKVIQCNIRDIIKRKQVEAQLKHFAAFDFLTDLPNKRLFEETISKEIARATRHHYILAVFFMDLDKFKEVNDTYGHDFGDLLLQKVGDRIQKSIRKEDFIARMGGDEFAIILPKINDIAVATRFAKKIINSMKKPFNISGRKIRITISIGISFFPYDHKKARALCKKADIALYRAKTAGRNNYQF